MFSAAVHAKAGRVRWDVAGWFGGAGMAGAGLGGFIAQGLPTEMLLSGRRGDGRGCDFHASQAAGGDAD
jgi:hypothetical protein